MGYPIEQVLPDGPWVVWSMSAENSQRSAAGLEQFDSYELGFAECCRRNLASAIELGIADEPMTMPAFANGEFIVAPFTHREFYEGRKQRGKRGS